MVKSTEVGVNKIVDFNFFYIKKILKIPAISGNKKKRTAFSVLFLVAGTGFEPATSGL